MDKPIIRALITDLTMSDAPDLTLLLQRSGDGDSASANSLFREVYGELRRMAATAMRGERPNHLLQPTALVNEAFLRLWDTTPSWDNRRHFFGSAMRSMRHILVDHARRQMSQKRGGDAYLLTLSAAENEPVKVPELDMLSLDELLTELEAINPRYAQVVEYRYLAGFNLDETADLLNVSLATVKRDWAFARAWLLDRLSPE